MNKIIEVSNLSVFYNQDQKVLDNVSFSLEDTNICALVGPNGAGKSTLFKSLMGFVQSKEGDIKIAGNDIKTALKKGLVSYVPQSEDVDWDFPILVQDVVMQGRFNTMGFLRRPKKEDKQAVISALNRVDMLDFAKRQIGALSGGQKKRVFIARALAQGAKIILLDEPFTGVDVKTEYAIIELILLLKKEGNLVLVSTHDLGSIPDYCDKALLIHQNLIAEGSVTEVFTPQNLQRAFGGILRHSKLPKHMRNENEEDIVILSDDEKPIIFRGNPKAKGKKDK